MGRAVPPPAGVRFAEPPFEGASLQASTFPADVPISRGKREGRAVRRRPERCHFPESGVLAFLYAAIDLTGYAGWTYPLRVIGRNSIASYVMAHLFDDFILRSFRTHLGQDVFEKSGGPYEPLVAGAAVLTVYWLILFWMDRRKIYLKV
jgi:hypothetical protein